MKVADLKMYLQREGESVKGTKEELVKRLLESKDILHKGAQSSQPEVMSPRLRYYIAVAPLLIKNFHIGNAMQKCRS